MGRRVRGWDPEIVSGRGNVNFAATSGGLGGHESATDLG